MYVIPEPGKTILDPLTNRMIPAEGAQVESSTYWRRRLKEGTVTQGTPPAAKPVKAKAQETKES
jgi:hypothetical protein